MEGIRLSVVDKWQIVADPEIETPSILKDGSTATRSIESTKVIGFYWPEEVRQYPSP
jgi:hypothetical protein